MANATGYKVVTTKAADLNEARVFAANPYEKLCFDVTAGGTLSSKTFKKTFDRLEKSLKTQGHIRQGASLDDTIEWARSYARGYFGQKRMSDVKPVDFADYWLWRKTNYWRKPPSNGILKRERIRLVSLLKFAKRRGNLSDISAMEAPQSKTPRRSTFTDYEEKTFYTRARA